MKTIIIVGGAYDISEKDFNYLDSMKEWISEIVYSRPKLAKDWADKNSVKSTYFPTFFIKNNKPDERAWIKRNEEMAKYSDQIIAFVKGHGTEHLLEMAKKYDLIIHLK